MNDLYPKYVEWIYRAKTSTIVCVGEGTVDFKVVEGETCPTLDIWTDRKTRAFMAITVRFWMTISKCKVTAWVLKGCTRDSIHNRFNSIFVQPAKKPRLLQYVCCSPNQNLLLKYGFFEFQLGFTAL